MLAEQELLPLNHPQPFLFVLCGFVCFGGGAAFCSVAQDDFKLLASGDSLALAPLVAHSPTASFNLTALKMKLMLFSLFFFFLLEGEKVI